MKVLSNRFEGLLRVCDGCGATLAYKGEDVYENKYIYCQICKMKLEVLYYGK